METIRDGGDPQPAAFHIAVPQPPRRWWQRGQRLSPNLYPHTPHHEGLPDPDPLDTIVTMASRLPLVDGSIVLGCEDLETIAAELLLQLRPLPEMAHTGIGVIAEAYQHDMGLTKWRAGRRGIRAEAVRDIARIAAGEASLVDKRSAVYRWMLGLWIPPERWEPPTYRGFRRDEITFIDGPLWAAWELSPVGVTSAGECGVHPGAKTWFHLGHVRIKPGISADRMVDEVSKRLKRL